MSTSNVEKRIVILISGRGSNMRSIVQACQRGFIKATVCCVISNVANAKGLVFASQNNIPAITVNHCRFESREAFDTQLVTEVSRFKPDLIVLAGFMRILTTIFVRNYENKILNIHPSLLPKYPGLNTHQRALDAGDHQHGSSVHFVIDALDSGAVIIQSRVDINNNDTSDDLAAKVLDGEHRIYPIAIMWVIGGIIRAEYGQGFYNNSAIVKPANWYNDVLTEPTTVL